MREGDPPFACASTLNWGWLMADERYPFLS
jgi:hypothetical protein